MRHPFSPSAAQPENLAEFAFVDGLLARLAAHEQSAAERPFVTLSYAQSLDGSIAVAQHRGCALSSAASLKLTHYLRARHAGLLVGVNTVIADDPRLTVRHCHGDSPRAVVLDSALRFPLTAHLLKTASQAPIVVTTHAAAEPKVAALAERGVEVVRVPANEHGRADLAVTLQQLAQRGVATLMVEGGGAVINRFLQERRVDYCVITLTPKIIGGFKAVAELCQPALTIAECGYQPLGDDLIVHGPLCLG